MVVNRRCPKCHLHSLEYVGFIFEGASGLQYLFMNFAMVFFAERRREFWIVMSTCGVMFLNTQNTGRNCDAPAFPFLLSSFAQRRADWLPIPHALPPLNVRYREKSDSAGSMLMIA